MLETSCIKIGVAIWPNEYRIYLGEILGFNNFRLIHVNAAKCKCLVLDMFLRIIFNGRSTIEYRIK